MINPEPYLLNGTEYSHEALIAFCEAQLRVPGTPPWEKALCRFIRDYFDETVPLVQKTSGTTGDPTIIPLQRPAMVRSAEMTLRHFNLLPGDRVLLCLPVEYIAGKMMVVRALVGGLDLVTVEPSGSPFEKLENAAETELKDLGAVEAVETELEDLESDEVAETELKDPGSVEATEAEQQDPESVEEEMEDLESGKGALEDPGSVEGELQDLESESVKGEQENSVSMKAVDFAAMVPLQLHETLKDAGSRAKLEQIGKLLIGGGEISPALREEVGKLRSVEVFESFAMSETYTHFAVRRINGEQPDPFFKVLEGVQIWTDRRGCLVVDVPGVTDRTVVSNDLVRLAGDQEFEWLGRIDNVIKSGGVKIVPEILEKKIAELTGQEVLVLGVPDKKLGQKLVLVVEEETVSGAASFAKEHSQTLFSKAFLSKVLQKHELPKEIITIPSFPRNNSMKIDRNAVVQIIIGKK
jgi:acyl-CoA synthetase (AMP-forming)/AMP-acid ligase II